MFKSRKTEFSKNNHIINLKSENKSKINFISRKSPSHVDKGAHKSVIFLLAQKCGWKSVREFL
jgi:hypothetical protein